MGGIIVASVVLEADLMPEERARCYALATNDLFDTRLTTIDQRSTLHGVRLGPLHVTFGHFSPRVTNRLKVLCERDRFDGVGLHWLRAGEWHGRAGNARVGGGEGTMTFFDFSQPFSILNEGECGFAMVMVPRSLAARLAEVPATLHGRTIPAPRGAVLAGFLAGIISHPDALRADEGAALADTLMDLATLALRSGATSAASVEPATRDGTRDRVEHLIDMRLAATDLTPDWIARKLGLSRTELYAAYPREGIARQIWKQRLDAARRLLADVGETRSITLIAEACGFTSTAHFSRAVKQEYGLTPSAIRRAVRLS